MYKHESYGDYYDMKNDSMTKECHCKEMDMNMPYHHGMDMGMMSSCCGGMGMGMNMGMGMSCAAPQMGMVCPPVYECPQERCCQREIIHEVPHVVPINTRIINHHIFCHSFTPCFTSCEENICSNVYSDPCGRC